MDWLAQLEQRVMHETMAPPVINHRSRLNGWRFLVNDRPVVLVLPCQVSGCEALGIARCRWPNAQPAGLTLERTR
ncbi:hypothetical protein [Halomonas sp. LBP4]|uniref:hypothetical protein n=1 Tax=Halomonas sp. LBP4 TaxID=2044917 RepID=UPI000D775698|nr:hypothetical protein [Halomonas sp. LBP4]PXX94992.1 hypothetical protein CR157_20470 [Halomonas sp. LBP4]